jgi:hypothetical protein
MAHDCTNVTGPDRNSLKTSRKTAAITTVTMRRKTGVAQAMALKMGAPCWTRAATWSGGSLSVWPDISIWFRRNVGASTLDNQTAVKARCRTTMATSGAQAMGRAAIARKASLGAKYRLPRRLRNPSSSVGAGEGTAAASLMETTSC